MRVKILVLVVALLLLGACVSKPSNSGSLEGLSTPVAITNGPGGSQIYRHVDPEWNVVCYVVRSQAGASYGISCVPLSQTGRDY